MYLFSLDFIHGSLTVLFFTESLKYHLCVCVWARNAKDVHVFFDTLGNITLPLSSYNVVI